MSAIFRDYISVKGNYILNAKIFNANANIVNMNIAKKSEKQKEFGEQHFFASEIGFDWVCIGFELALYWV